MSTRFPFPGARSLGLAAEKLARCRELNEAIAWLAREPLDEAALRQVSATQTRAVAASEALAADLDEADEFDQLWSDPPEKGSGAALGERGAAPSDPDGPHRYIDGGAA